MVLSFKKMYETTNKFFKTKITYVKQQENTLYPQKWQNLGKHFLKLLIGSAPMVQGRSLICGRRGYHSINLDNSINSLRKICHLWG